MYQAHVEQTRYGVARVDHADTSTPRLPGGVTDGPDEKVEEAREIIGTGFRKPGPYPALRC